MSKTISVIGPNSALCTNDLLDFAFNLGVTLVDLDYTVINGGMKGVMEAVFKGAHNSTNYAFGKTIGIIPSYERSDANEFCDIVIPTGMGYARNILVVNSSDTIIALAGGAGTLSEIAFAWQLGKTIYTFDNFGGWSKELADIEIDNR
ncbi:MAG: TIGR00725 family protein, partial [Candidatus Cloacimonetes bacterium]|nr:TIGR00725 family protein [Candidatus Cloacimonadota bacterium]